MKIYSVQGHNHQQSKSNKSSFRPNFKSAEEIAVARSAITNTLSKRETLTALKSGIQEKIAPIFESIINDVKTAILVSKHNSNKGAVSIIDAKDSFGSIFKFNNQQFGKLTTHSTNGEHSLFYLDESNKGLIFKIKANGDIKIKETHIEI